MITISSDAIDNVFEAVPDSIFPVLTTNYEPDLELAAAFQKHMTGKGHKVIGINVF